MEEQDHSKAPEAKYKHVVLGLIFLKFTSDKFEVHRQLLTDKDSGEFYTPKSIVNLIAEMIEPYKGIIYDPACGSGGMFDLGNDSLGNWTFWYFNLLSNFVQNEIKNVGGDSAQTNISNAQIQEIKLIYPTKYLIDRFNRLGKPFVENILNKIEENQKLSELKSLLLSRLSTSR